MIATEKVEIEISLSSSFWDKAPKAKVYVDDNLIFDSVVDQPIKVKFNGDLTEDRHKLIIELYDKDKYQTVVKDDQIIKDQLLNIDAILFDEIDIQFLKHTLSKYFPVQHSNEIPKEVTNCVNLGYNGRWELEFTTPVYIWLLENI